MSVAGAIKAGSAFVEFTGDLSALMRASKEAGRYLSSWASKVSNQASTEIAGGMGEAANAATQFGNQAGAATEKASSGLTSVIAKTATLTTGMLTLGGGFSALKSGAGSLMGLMGGLSGLAKLTGSLSWGLRGVSIVMKMMGKDASHLEPWIRGLWRVSWGVWAVDKAYKAAKLSAMALRAVVTAPMKIAGAVGRGIGRMGRFGGMGIAGASVAEAASGETAEGEQPNTAKAVGGGAMAGAMMGGLAGAGIGAAAVGVGLVIKTALSRGAKEGASEATDFLTRMGFKMLAIGQWIGSTFTKLKDTVLGAFKGMGSGGNFLGDLEQALFPIIDAVENVWIPALANGMSYLASFFKGSTENMHGSWSTFIVNTIGGLADFVANFDLYFQYAQQSIVMWASNSILQIGDFFTNVGIWLDWFGKNWSDVLFTVGDLAATVFINIGENIRSIFTEIWNLVKSGFRDEIEVDWKPLTEGFHSAIQEWPDLVATELETSTPEMDNIAKRIAGRQAATAKRAEEFKGLQYTPTDKKKKRGREKEFDPAFAAAEARSQDAYAALARLQNSSLSGSNPQVEAVKNVVKEQQKTNGKLDKVIDTFKGGQMAWEIP